MKIPPRAINAANRILARLPSTKWTPQERDIAAAIIGNETGQEKALEACRMLLAAFTVRDESGAPLIEYGKLSEACRMAELALRR